MTHTVAYITTSELRAHLGYRPEFVEDDAQIGYAIDAASQMIDDYCGRTFTLDTAAEAHTYNLVSSPLFVDDVSDTTTATVEWSSDRLTWQTLDADTYYWNHEHTGHAGGDRVNTIWHALTFPGRGWLRVTAVHGWSEVPDVVVAATKLVAAQLLSRRHSPNGIEVSFEGGGAIRASRYLDGHAELMLRPYRRVDAFAGIA